MGLSTTVPLDIIDEIMNNIHDDMTSLKACSLAARPFYQPTRRHLFAAITLDHPDAVASLNQTVLSSPQLSDYIRSLDIPSLSESTIREIVQILPALPHIRRMVLGVQSAGFAAQPLSSELFTTLSDILRLPLLETLQIFSIRGFPVFLLHIPHRLKYLTLRNVFASIADSHPTRQPLLHLKSLSVYRVRSRAVFGEVSSLINAPNLVQVIFGEVAMDMRTFVDAETESINTFVWENYLRRQAYPVVFARILRNLRHLCVVLNDVGREDHAQEQIHLILRKDGLAERLEKFTFVIGKSRNDSISIPVLRFMVLGDIWQDFADRVRFPRLTSVTIYLVNEGRNLPPIDPATFHPLVSRELPMLAEADLLRTTVCKQLEWNDLH